ncbi:zf-HC2 domain-containing protein [Gordonia aquimaris]|uniref:Zf-HC2 domain-containing protein n=1 Tax=Gordonia aquimaris TaxID=2984863 RepID=A0A9X3D5C1_9ACTN|nr:zf-HC2 domain-containing protein [Gordonia aquimaris]MCX2964564.1 zf-HC2 domain-containing protein [Gordonia aquimaris]
MAREALSARIDGEYEGVPSARVDEHLAECPSCRDWLAMATRQSGVLSELGRSEVPDLSSAVLDEVAPPSATSFAAVHLGVRRNIVRIGLTLAGAAQIVIAMVQMTGADFGMTHGGHPESTHLVNETTAWALALGVCMVVAAWWQRALPGLLVVLSVFTVVLAGYVIHDAIAGQVTLARMLSHLPVVVGLGFAAWGSLPRTPGSRSDGFDLDRWSSGPSPNHRAV